MAEAMFASAFSDTEFLQVADQLPTAPRLLVELSGVIRQPFVTTDEIVARLRHDAGLVARLIAVANSAVYARAEPAGSIEEAVAALGFRELHRLVGAVASRQLADQPLGLHGVSGARLRENALFVAVVMEELAEETGEEPRSCYTVGLLRSVGKMALDRVARGGEIPPFAESGEAELGAWERKYWGVDNCRVAELILKHWRLPHETVIAIQHHYAPAGRHNPVIHLLALAAAAAQDRYFGLPGEAPYLQLTPENFRRAGIDERRYQIACERAQRTFQRLHAVVN
jgi:HD-like signal output (HDOD) protein